MFFRRKPEPQPPAHFGDAPEAVRECWNDLSGPARVRREMAALLLAEMRVTGPAWPTERYDMLNKLLSDG